MARIAIVLPLRESFTPEAAGAIALVVRRFAAALPGSVVLGPDPGGTFPGIVFKQVLTFRQACAQLRRLRPEVIEVHQKPYWAVAFALLFRRARVVLFLHNDPQSIRGLRSRLGRRLTLALLHRVVCVSDYLAARYAQGLRHGPDVLHNPLDPGEIPAPTPKQKLILFAGRVVPDKAPDVFIAACVAALPDLPGWRAEMIGGDSFGPNSPQTGFFLTQQAAAAAAGIGFRGPRPHDEVLAAMNEAAIVVVPSRWAEPFGLTALEALACGAALITTGQGGLSEVAGPAALYIAPDDVDALATALRTLVADAPRRAALAAAGRQRAREFFTPAITPRLQALRDAV
ncbi:glycosyltransferase family 4 protein [Acidocella aminolytica]|jgi:glycosyltransferase involved in cell wall biosynthesis|uniref:Glycosyl/hexosyl transferase n=2 Tax=Acidocella TaxID=50709 RepID=A0A0D6PFG5_9PROT|nr:glycosyltransferase family 4 protein [Acidocella aminolytica]GAN79948.1 glycosyl/hexosyl transferase [Acidocella aminolytica 101 = DSM 11237]SHE58630.1 Glycosyltransferase involved in cell wall bisynthesis [Acidocella aminolytica 101 = DSM 11237]